MKDLRNASLIAIAALLCFLGGLKVLRSNNANDFYQFWAVGQAVRAIDINDVYFFRGSQKVASYFLSIRRNQDISPHFRKVIIKRARPEFAGTPFLYFFFSAVSTGDFDVDYNIYFIASLALYLGAILIFGALIGLDGVSLAVSTFLLTFLFWPLRLECRFGNVNELQLGVLALITLLMSNRPGKMLFLVCGWLLASLIVFKPNIWALFFILNILIVKQYPGKGRSAFLIGEAAGFFSGWLIPKFYFGDKVSWSNWWETFEQILARPQFAGQSFVSKLFGLHENVSQTLFGYVFVVLVCIFLWFYASNRESLKESLLSAISFGGLVFLLSSKLVHGHYFIFAIPALLRTQRWSGASKIKIAGSIAFVLITLHPFLKEWGLTTDPYISAASYIGVLILLAAEFSVMRRRAVLVSE